MKANIYFPCGKMMVRDIVGDTPIRGLRFNGSRPTKIKLCGDCTFYQVKCALMAVHPYEGDVVFECGDEEYSFKDKEAWNVYRTLHLLEVIDE